MTSLLTDKVSSFINGFLSSLSTSPKSPGTGSHVVILMALLVVSMLLDISQLVFVLVGAVAYGMMQPVKLKTRTKLHQEKYKNHASKDYICKSPKANLATWQRQPLRTSQCREQRDQVQAHPKLAYPPVLAPTFRSEAWDAQVNEFAALVAPKPQGEEIMNKLIRHVKRSLEQVLPGVEVVGIASGDITCSRAYGVAVPEVEIIINASPAALAQRLQKRLENGGNSLADLDLHKLHKSVIRVCTDKLISSGFKFRRSAFRGEEPKVTLTAPAELGIFKESIPLDFLVNAITPFYKNALLTECGQIDSRAKDLMLVVQRWAKDRGISHVAKGNLSPYMWSLLTIYFLQVGLPEGALLPPLQRFKMSSQMMQRKPSASTSTCGDDQWPSTPSQKTTGQLFKDFITFYKLSFSWKTECISLGRAQRGNPPASFPLHMTCSEDGRNSEVGPSIENPFKANENLASAVTAFGLERMHTELGRAYDLMAKDASLSELLEPWIPIDTECASGRKDEEQ